MDTQRYLAAERDLWRDAGITPIEHRLRLPRNDVDVRVLEAGAGPPVVFIHGGPGAAGPIFSHLAARLPAWRCLLLDRPGSGLSAAHPLADAGAVRVEAETLLVDVLDGLGIERAHLVGSSHGSYVALLSAAAHPDRVDRTVHLGCPGFVEGMVVRGFDRLVLAPGVARMLSRLPASEGSLRSTMRQLGHEAAVADGRIGEAFIAWATALQRDTPTMANELASMANMGSFRGGFDASLTVGRALLERVVSPTYVLWGEHEPYGDRAVGQQLVDALPDGQFEVLAGAGHLCWLDDVEHAAAVIDGHLSG